MANCSQCGSPVEPWVDKHLSPSQVQDAVLRGNYETEGEQMIAACPSATGSGVLDQ